MSLDLQEVQPTLLPQPVPASLSSSAVSPTNGGPLSKPFMSLMRGGGKEPRLPSHPPTSLPLWDGGWGSALAVL